MSLNTLAPRKVSDIKPLIYVNGQTREITINPNQQFLCEVARVGRVRREIASIAALCLKPYADYTLYLEISEPHVNCTQEAKYYHFPRVHVHGIVKFHDVIGFLETGFHKMAGLALFTINQYDPEYWTAYSTKQAELWIGSMYNPIIKPSEKLSKLDLEAVGCNAVKRQFVKNSFALDDEDCKVEV